MGFLPLTRFDEFSALWTPQPSMLASSLGFKSCEDQSRIRTDHGPENIALLRKVAMNLAKSERTHKRGIQAKRKLAAWNDEYLIKLLQAGLPEKQIK